MRVVFWASPEFAIPTLEALIESAHDIVAVVTQSPKATGRGRKLASTPVARRAEQAGIPVLAPDRPRGREFLEALRGFEPDVFVVVAYGAILPPEVLALPPLGAINVHASLLPELRGAAPVTRAILEGRAETGVTIMRMDEGLDTGPILLTASTPILPDDTAGTLTERLASLGAGLLVAALGRLARGELPETPQDSRGATHAPKVTVAEAELDWSRPAAQLERAARAYDPWPGAWTRWRGERLNVARLEIPAAADAVVGGAVGDGAAGGGSAPGTIVALDPAPLVRAGDGVVRLALVQPAGGRRMSGEAWARGRRVAPGERLGA